MKKKKIVINGKFLLAALEGMPRVGREICSAMDILLELDEYAQLDIRMAVPRGGAKKAFYKNISIEEVGLLQGLLWEQIDFPFYIKDAFSINFTGTAPLFKRNGCVVVHDAQFRSTRQSHNFKSAFLYNFVTPRAARRYKAVATVSQYAHREIVDYNVCDRGDIVVIPNGADHVLRVEKNKDALSKFGLSSRNFALANSYVHTHKNVRILLEAFANYDSTRILVLFGTSTLDDYKARGIDVPTNVRFLGRIDDQDLMALMSECRMFLFPSTTEGFGLPPLEAMLLGSPTICARAGAMPENCGEGVLYADPKSAGSWLQVISTLWDDLSLQNDLSCRGRVQANKFKWSNAARSYLDLMIDAA